MTALAERRFTYGDASVRRAVSATLDRMVARRLGRSEDLVTLEALERKARRAMGVEKQVTYGAALSNAVNDMQEAGLL